MAAGSVKTLLAYSSFLINSIKGVIVLGIHIWCTDEENAGFTARGTVFEKKALTVNAEYRIHAESFHAYYDKPIFLEPTNYMQWDIRDVKSTGNFTMEFLWLNLDDLEKLTPTQTQHELLILAALGLVTS